MGADTEKGTFSTEVLETDIMVKSGIVERDDSYSGINAIVFTECISHTSLSLEPAQCFDSTSVYSTHVRTPTCWLLYWSLQRGLGVWDSVLSSGDEQEAATLRLLLTHVTKEIDPKSPSVNTGAPRRSTRSFLESAMLPQGHHTAGSSGGGHTVDQATNSDLRPNNRSDVVRWGHL